MVIPGSRASLGVRTITHTGATPGDIFWRPGFEPRRALFFSPKDFARGFRIMISQKDSRKGFRKRILQKGFTEAKVFYKRILPKDFARGFRERILSKDFRKGFSKAFRKRIPRKDFRRGSPARARCSPDPGSSPPPAHFFVPAAPSPGSAGIRGRLCAT